MKDRKIVLSYVVALLLFIIVNKKKIIHNPKRINKKHSKYFFACTLKIYERSTYSNVKVTVRFI